MAIEQYSTAIYPATYLDWEGAAVWFRDALERVGLERFGLQVMPHASEWWSSGDRLMLAGGAVLTNRELAEASDDPGWGMTLYYMDYPTRGGVIASVPVWPEGDGIRSPVWSWLTGVLEALVVEAEADICVVNGSGDGDESERLLSEEEIARPLPAALTAWNYYGPARLDESRRERLARLPAYLSRPHGAGWLLRPMEYYSGTVPSGLLDAYSALAGAPAELLRA